MRSVVLGVLVFVVVLAGAVPAPAPKQQKPKEDVVVVVTKVDSRPPVMAATSSRALDEHFPAPNKIEDAYPTLKGGQYYIKAKTYGVAPPPQIDPEFKAAHGVDGDLVHFGQDKIVKHPMEEKTPLEDFTPCSPDNIINVEIPALETQAGHSTPFLPVRFGCSKEKDISREKASPEVIWGNYSISQVKDFSLQLVSMGDSRCSGEGADGYNNIYWHITGIKHDLRSPTFRLPEGSSNDRRLLAGGKEQPNQWLEDYYSGPCPPPGVVECFRLKVLGHLLNGNTCECGHKDFLFLKPEAPKLPTPWVYKESKLAPLGSK